MYTVLESSSKQFVTSLLYSQCGHCWCSTKTQQSLASSIGLERETFNLKVAGSSPALGFSFFVFVIDVFQFML